ncbi:MAG: UDP-N-acetylmuramoyl-tripeptide--D-alanyl-D-alanine ligase, partial [Actinobacteria bacterium]|nr:UDP-N-acetylmuramoyl-tripeptide--D-alanyl-D-alanine ligase [Actinomycetota bacterium]
MELTVSDIAATSRGRILAGDPGCTATSFTYDSRLLEPGACFFALRGARDGHDFVADAFARGARVAVVSRDPGDLAHGGARAIVEVPDTLHALGDCGRLARDRMPDATVVGVTGSAGKTSTKDLTAAVLARRFDVLASPGSFNNESGLPLTLLAGGPDTEVIVAEMGARFAGNIRDLCEIARPKIGVITNVGLAHAEHLGARADIARVKGELLDALPPDGVAILNADDEMTPALAANRRFRVVPVGFDADPRHGVRVGDVRVDAQLRPTFTLSSPWGELTATVGVRGHHQAVNAGMAAAVALVLGVEADDVVAGLAATTGSSWRMQLERSPGGLIVLNDAYNASPGTMEAALRSFAYLPVAGRRIAVLGEMRELGAYSTDEHRKLGRLVADVGLDALVAVGDAGREIAGAARAARVDDVVEAANTADALAAVVALAGPADAVLVKGSRAVGLEVLADALVAGAADVTHEVPHDRGSLVEQSEPGP